jgi:hypothetical protein
VSDLRQRQKLPVRGEFTITRDWHVATGPGWARRRPGRTARADPLPSIWLGLFSDDAEAARLGAMYLRIVGPVYVCFGLGLGLFFVSQGFGRGFAAMIANAVRLLVSAGAGLAAVYWLNLGPTGLFTAIACGFCIYAALTTLAVVRMSPPATPSAQ